ncbi:kelch-like protein 1 [Bactrocera tryoni]|uniref:kelch-like protein 1 n=1 Tax=Bactrocera tryoni TaxID=59916 RepID=UPI001A978393|nr:kelch-like protein 1 [Bactrocera tryoni]XP_039970534.1 kelch-like protein 1 [Bactrocera tryoni]
MATSSTEKPVLQSNSSAQKRFMEKLMRKIFCFYDGQYLMDVVFNVLNSTCLIPAHRLILSAASPYFKNLFNADQGINPTVEINDIDSDTLERLIIFCYTGQLPITVSNGGAMLKAAIVLQLDDAISTCVDYIVTHINDYTLQRAYTLERETECELLKQKIIEYEIQNFMKVSQSDEFMNFDVEKLQGILESDNLNITREEDAYDAIKLWINHDVRARQEQLPLLIASLRLTQLSTDFLLTHIHPLPGCELLAMKAVLWISEPKARTKINIRFTEPRVFSAGNCSETTLLAVCSKMNGSNLLQYNKTEDEWQDFASIKFDYRCFSTILQDDNILFIGGCNKYTTFNNVLCWNIRNKTCRNLPAMNQARYWHCVVELDEKIYAIGGRVGNENLSSVERYTKSDGWKFVNSLIVGREGAGAVSLNGKIYIVGGYCGNSSLKSVECYNPDSNTWTPCADMKTCHYLPGVAAHNGHIYVLGSWWRKSSRTVERYDPQQNKWSQIYCLEGVYGNIAGVSLDNKLWALGGTSNSDDKTSLLVYDEETYCWEQKCSLLRRGRYSCFVVPAALLASE